MPYNHLSAEEERVIVNKGTEMPFSGEYDKLFSPGTFICRRCNNPLYSAEAKFHSGCGWPSFDEEYPGSVERHLDAIAGRNRADRPQDGGAVRVPADGIAARQDRQGAEVLEASREHAKARVGAVV